MGKFKNAVIFLLGAVAGGVGTWLCLRETFELYVQQEIDSTKQAFHAREEKLRKEIEELKSCLKSESDEGETAEGTASDGVRGKYTQYAKTPESMKPFIEGLDNAAMKSGPIVEAPYVISPEEFGEIDGYTQISLTYFADNILADENGVIIDNTAEIVGDALDHFGEYEDDSVYCRSDPKRCDYEILRDLRKYADVRKTLLPRTI